MTEIEKLRREIDSIDEEIARSLRRRVEVARTMGGMKEGAVYDPVREFALMERLRNLCPDIDAKALDAIYREVISLCRAVQRRLRAACMGPAGSFSQEATIKALGSHIDVVFVDGPQGVFDAIVREKADLGVVPVENTIEGTVYTSLDAFSTAPQDIRILSEVRLPIAHMLATWQTSIDEVDEVHSHPQALAQCRLWLRTNLPRARQIPASSTSAAAASVKGQRGKAAICSRLAAEINGLDIAMEHIEDQPHNTTRFWVVGRQPNKPFPRNKTSILFNVPHKPGTLFEALEPFYEARLNLTLIQSRPLPGNPFEYNFFVDFEGDASDEVVAKTLEKIKSRSARFRLLGSYPCLG